MSDELMRYDISTEKVVPVTKEWLSVMQHSMNKVGFCRNVVSMLHDPDIWVKLTSEDFMEIEDLIRKRAGLPSMAEAAEAAIKNRRGKSK